MELEYYYIVMKSVDGTLSTADALPEGAVAQRKATADDIFRNAETIVDEIEKNDLALRVANIVTSRLAPPQQDVPTQVLDALKERGIDPTTVTPTP